jgi:cytochrome c-type biogenesis protein
MFDITIFGAALGGLLSFVSPCVLPIVPFYLSYLAGVSIGQLNDGADLPRSVRQRAVLAAICFSAGVITVFVGLGASATVFGQVVRDYFDVLRYVAGAIIVAMGLHFIGIVKIPILYRQFQSTQGDVKNVSLLGAYVIGLAFAFGWTPCVGPVLAAILFTAAGQETAMNGALLLFVYGAGMTMPFVLAALFIRPFMGWMARFRRHLGRIEMAMGVFLIVFGVLIATNRVNLIAQWMLDTIPWISGVG